MAVNCSWADAQVQTDVSVCSQLPTELLHLISTATSRSYLNALASASLNPSFTDKFFVLYEPLIVEITAQWIGRSETCDVSESITVLSCLARILPFASYLKPRLKDLLKSNELLKNLGDPGRLSLINLTDEQQQVSLLAWFRLLTYDTESFRFFISPVQLLSILKHTSSAIRCLVIQCFGLQMGWADAALQNTIMTHIGDWPAKGTWESMSIDFRLITLFEEDRWTKLRAELDTARLNRPDTSFLSDKGLTRDLMSSSTAKLADVLLPRSSAKSLSSTPFVHTLTSVRNLRSLGQALLEPRPILLTGKPGSGKTSLINEAARELNKLSTMVTLHLNEQTDAKSLVGLYTTSTTGGSFVWQPGVLTRAMQEGRWLLIEDIDRAPSEVIGVLLPIIERGELFLPNQGKQVRAADDFRILATMRTSNGTSRSPPRSLMGSRLWKQIVAQELQGEETTIVLNSKFPLIRLHVKTILNVQRRVRLETEHNIGLRNLRTGDSGLRTLLKWCYRIQTRLELLGVTTVHEAISETVKDDIFMDAVDCFAGHMPTQDARLVLAACIAEELHLPPQRMLFCLRDRIPSYQDSDSDVSVGRAKLPKMKDRKLMARRNTAVNGHFALTRHALKTMETMLAAIELAEPLLLVGETGIGKTTLVQYLARAANQKLTVINLSQQSEASDLLGGFKPITTRSLALPLIDTFNDLFDATFSAQKNQQFQSSITKSATKQKWQRLLSLWQEATNMAENILQRESGKSSSDNAGEQPLKRRKVESTRYRALRQRWTDFASRLQAFSAQLSRGDSNFAFAFVEGRIVDAVRNGEWVLFDEINLATPDTLESISSLLTSADDGLPSLLLPEAGNLERVMGSPTFRIFAAMNPATDTGKKDLAPGLRSRFTEIFVPSPDDDLSDLMALVKTYLGPLADIDERAAQDVAQLYLQIKKMSEAGRLTDGAGERPHFSVRSLVRCLMYVIQQAPAYGLRRAIYEGFTMSFLTMLSKDSERCVLPILDQHILSAVKNARSILKQPTKIPTDTQVVRFKHHWLARGPLPLQDQPNYVITPFVESNLLNLARATSMKRFPILLQGPTSSGKTSMVEYLAKISGHRFVRINNHEHTDLQEYLGSYASDDRGKLEYREGILVQALREGHWIVLDELNLAPTDVLEALNRLLDDNRELLIPESQEVVKPHPNFMLFATQNPAGAYGGRKRLSRAFRNRFLEIHFDDIPENELEFILTKRSQIAPSFCSRIVSVYKKLAILRQSARLFEQRNSFVTLRDLFRWAFRRADDRQQLANNGYMLLAERVRDPTERRKVKDIIEEVMKVKIDEDSLYSVKAVPEIFATSNDIVWTPAMRRLYVLVSEAMKKNEPVLLIGETGCGKTQICQTVARAAGIRLQIYNAHTNTETGDLIGAQRPTRHSREANHQLKTNLERLMGDLPYTSSDSDSRLEYLVQLFERGEFITSDPLLLKNIRGQLAHRNSLFEWMDGSLVRAMKEGDYFLLDEISLAEDSVLERLNSVLETERTLFLAEKGPIDPSVIAVPSFQFMATMNPGGDYGKRELSAALRNRFTEIWVPALTEDMDILPILQSRLRDTIPDAGIVMVEFAKWFSTSFQNSTSTSVSLRHLLSWCDFIQATSTLEPYRSVLHGASMVFIDALGANPAAMLAMGIENIARAREQCLVELGRLLHRDVSSVYHEGLSLQMGAKLQVGSFRISANPDLVVPHDLVFEAPTTLKNAMRVVRALQLPKAIMLEGNPGAGKTALITALASAAGRPLTRINLSDQTDLMDLFGADLPTEGAIAGSFTWRDGPLLQAMQSGTWVLLDEMNLASQSVLEGLNSCLDHRQEIYISELDRTFKRHPDFVLFAAQNPHHRGGGRKGLPASFVNRFTVVYAETFDVRDLTLICRQRFPRLPSPDLANILSCFLQLQRRITRHRAFIATGNPWDLNLRDITRWIELCIQLPTGSDSHQSAEIVIGQRFRTAEQKAIISEIFGLLPKQISQKGFYHNLTPTSYQVGSATVKRNLLVTPIQRNQSIITPTTLPTAEAVMHCVDRAWPGVLVGSTGCGKTTLLRNIAAIVGTPLVELAVNADTDTMDLIGGFEQYDPTRSSSALRIELSIALQEYIARGCAEDTISDGCRLAFKVYEHCIVTKSDLKSFRPLIKALAIHDELFLNVLAKIDAAVVEDAQSQLQFKWIDGPLMEAVEQGHWVVLDNANLCNPSVLDRLNSLLEPHGTLIVSEQHTASGQPRSVKPHKNFRIFLTMNPRYGELSPAMRNRSLEIFMHDHGISDAHDLVPVYPCVSSIARFRPLLSRSWVDFRPEIRSQISNIGLGRVSLKEHMSSHLWQDEISSSSCLEDLEAQLRHCQTLPAELVVQIRDFYSVFVTKSVLHTSDLSYQPLRATANQLVLSTGGDTLDRARDLAWLQDMFIYLAEAQQRLDDAARRAKILKTSDMTILEVSFHAETSSKAEKHTSRGLSIFLQSLANAVYQALHKALRAPFQPQSYHALLSRTLTFLADLIHLTVTTNLQPEVEQVYFQIGQTISTDLCFDLPILGQDFTNALTLLHRKNKLKYGQSLVRMWNDWRPATAQNLAHQEQLVALEEVSDQFDAMVDRVTGSVLSCVEIRTKLLRAWRDVLIHGGETTSLIEQLKSAVNTMKMGIRWADSVRPLFMANEFENLCQIRDLHVNNFRPLADQSEALGCSLQILAGRRTRVSEMSSTKSAVPIVLSTIADFAGFANSTNMTCAWRRNFTTDLITKTGSCKYQQLGTLASLGEVMVSMISAVSNFSADIMSDSTLGLKSEVGQLLQHTIDIHQDLFESQPFSSRDDLAEPQYEVPRFRADLPRDHYFRAIAADYLSPAASDLSRHSLTEKELLISIGAALFRVCLASLHLFVPNQSLDPALGLAIDRERYDRRLSELQVRLEGLQVFESKLTGSKDTIQTQWVEEEILSLGDRPPLPGVVRPRETALPSLAADFSSLLTSVVTKAPEALLLSSVAATPSSNDFSVVSSRRTEADLLQQNIVQSVMRLSNGYRSYMDLTTPIVRYLQCLGFSVDLLLLRDSPANNAAKTIELLSSETPMLGGKPGAVMASKDLLNSLITLGSDVQLQWLDFAACKIDVCRLNCLDPGGDHAILNIVNYFYQEWKTQLTRDQQLQTKRSKYYEYRGEDENDDAAIEIEMAQLFPKFDNQDGVVSEDAAIAKYDPKAFALKLANLLATANINSAVPSGLDEYVFGALDLLISTDVLAKLDLNPVQPHRMLPGALLLMNREAERLSETSTSKTINIYTDADMGEIRKLHELVLRTARRFDEILLTWPEHALLQDVCACCKEVLQFKFSDPLAKVLTKVEKLHQFVSEWQAVASKEFSVMELVDDLTRLIVSWRRLELSSWAHLLDIERQKGRDDAKGWFFVVYEVVVAIPFQILEAGDSITAHVDGLIKTLEDFIKNSNFGQFEDRLRLLEEVSSFLSRFAAKQPSLRFILSSIVNLLQHYGRYSASVNKYLNEGRKKLEREIQDQIRLASWRDTNVTALRDSARRSHHKLFKTVRKYRALLAQPVTFSTPESAYKDANNVATDLLEVRTQRNPSAADEALDTCVRNVKNWQARPARLRDSIGAAASIRQLYLSTAISFNASQELNVMTIDLSALIQELRKQTPSKLTEDNKGVIQHLKVRKRRLLAEVLKNLRHMGIQRNLGVNELAKQSSTARILSTTPDISSEDSKTLHSANDEFHAFIGLMPSLRAALQDHSDELTNIEVTRGVGAAEGLLLILRKQRSSLSPVLAGITQFQKVLETTTNLQSEKLEQILPVTDTTTSTRNALQQQLSWLPRIIDLSCKVLWIQAKYSDIDDASIVDSMNLRSQSLRSLNKKLQDARAMPPGISTKETLHICETATQEISEVGRYLTQCMIDEPRIAYILEQILPWTETHLDDIRITNGSTPHTLDDLDQTICRAVDKMFVAMQRVNEVRLSTTVSFEDSDWLTNQDTSIKAVVKALHVETITIALDSALYQIKYMSGLQMSIAISLFVVVTPIIEQFYFLCRHVIEDYAALHHGVCKYANLLAKNFLVVTSEGFCSPTDGSVGKDEQSGQIEQGTGLGDGEGAEDISKDVGDDEDLSELAQEKDRESKQNDINDAEDAVDMGQDDLEGQMDDRGQNREDEDGEVDSDEENDEREVEEQADSVDDLDPSAVDEKLWDGLADEKEKGLEQEKGDGQASEDKAASKQNQKAEKPNISENEEEEDGEDEQISDGEEGEAVGRELQEQIDPYAEQEEALELPDEMQLDGEKDINDDATSEDGIDELSDVEQHEDTDNKVDDNAVIEDEILEDAMRSGASEEESEGDGDSDNQSNSGILEDKAANGGQSDEETNEAEEHRKLQQDENTAHAEEAFGEDDGIGGQADNEETKQESNSAADQDQNVTSTEDQPSDEPSPENGANGSARRDRSDKKGQHGEQADDQQAEAFKKLGDILDQWHQRREIMKHSQETEKKSTHTDIELADADFEHVEDDNDQGDAQALGAASKDQARALDQSKAVEDDAMDPEEDIQMPDVDEDVDGRLPENELLANLDRLMNADHGSDADAHQGSIAPAIEKTRVERDLLGGVDDAEDLDDVDHQFSAFQLSPATALLPTSLAEASRLWTQYSASIHPLSLLLTEQLRLILAPTLATKLRGDFRTGKRLNIKRIIPYIASGYKRDKIWMRRSVPSKRAYQIMIAVDNSKSMMEGGAGALALEALALLAKSLSMLEVGELCVVGFGDEDHIRVAHPFEQSFTNDSGAAVFQHFSFQQTATDVRRLVAESTALFRDARAKSNAQNADLWQLELVISDGICEDHDTIRRLVRQAAEERIMVVFVIVDSVHGSSILDLTQATFEPDTAEGAGGGEMKLKMKRYLDDFPFPYYLIVRDVRDLPTVLATALKGWFAEVVDVQG